MTIDEMDTEAFCTQQVLLSMLARKEFSIDDVTPTACGEDYTLDELGVRTVIVAEHFGGMGAETSHVTLRVRQLTSNGESRDLVFRVDIKLDRID